MFLYDGNIKKFIKKDVYSYGFIVNQVGELEGKRFNFESVGIDSEPEYYKGVRFRTFVEMVSPKTIAMGVETAKSGKGYTLYGKQILTRLS
jgi:hypothetical protein